MVLRKVSDSILAILLMGFILSASVTATLAFKPLYYFDIGYLHIEEDSGYSKEEIKDNYDVLIAYNLSPSIQKLEFPAFEMSDEGRIHFEEVKVIFQFFLRMVLVCGVLAMIGIVWKRKRREYQYLMMAGTLLPTILVVVGGLIALNWDRAFVLFHEIAFQNDYWMFDAVTDPVITILPDIFFLHCAVMILAGIALGTQICILCYKKCRRNLYNR